MKKITRATKKFIVMLYDVIIIGSGPAGLTAAIYTVRAALKTLVIAGYKHGGQLMQTTLVENFPGFPRGIDGPELMMNMRQQAENLGVEFVDRDAVEVNLQKQPFIVGTKKISNQTAEADNLISSGVKNDSSENKIISPRSDDVYLGKSLIVATGADTKWLSVPGEQELIGRGVSSCAPCDAFFFRGKNVAVVGGGDTAMEEATVLAKVANSVTIIHRGNSFKASKAMQEKVFKNSKIKVLWDMRVIEVLGKEKMSGLKLKDKNDEITDITMDGVFIAIGHIPNTEIFKGKIYLDERGFMRRYEIREAELLKYWSATNIEGVFVAGDVNDYRYMQAITASGFGCMAALDVQRWLEEKG